MFIVLGSFSQANIFRTLLSLVGLRALRRHISCVSVSWAQKQEVDLVFKEMSTHWAATVLRNFGLEPQLVAPQTTRPDTESGQCITKYFCCNKRNVTFVKKN